MRPFAGEIVQPIEPKEKTSYTGGWRTVYPGSTGANSSRRSQRALPTLEVVIAKIKRGYFPAVLFACILVESGGAEASDVETALRQHALVFCGLLK
jgi:hypothetical protein